MIEQITTIGEENYVLNSKSMNTTFIEHLLNLQGDSFRVQSQFLVQEGDYCNTQVPVTRYLILFSVFSFFFFTL